MIFNQILFGVLALIVIASAIGMILNRNAVYSALLLALNFSTVALLYLLLGAPLIHVIPKGTFYCWLKLKGKLGGQNKVPRLANERKYVEEILTMIQQNTSGNPP